MSPIVLLNHVLNFMAPALWLALFLPLAARFVFRKRSASLGLGAQMAVNFGVGLILLGTGLWFFGRDGKMAAYLGMTLACATSQWLMLRGWRA